MFTPNENAFTIATNHDQSLRLYAFGKNVFVVTPGNFPLVVKMISELLQKDKIGIEAADMAKQALEFYNKVCGFLESFEGEWWYWQRFQANTKKVWLE